MYSCLHDGCAFTLEVCPDAEYAWRQQKAERGLSLFHHFGAVLHDQTRIVNAILMHSCAE